MENFPKWQEYAKKFKLSEDALMDCVEKSLKTNLPVQGVSIWNRARTLFRNKEIDNRNSVQWDSAVGPTLNLSRDLINKWALLSPNFKRAKLESLLLYLKHSNLKQVAKLQGLPRETVRSQLMAFKAECVKLGL